MQYTLTAVAHCALRVTGALFVQYLGSRLRSLNVFHFACERVACSLRISTGATLVSAIRTTLQHWFDTCIYIHAASVMCIHVRIQHAVKRRSGRRATVTAMAVTAAAMKVQHLAAVTAHEVTSAFETTTLVSIGS
jgi:hypothetical protein